MAIVAHFSFPYEAHIARAKLEAMGISAQVLDEHTVNMQWLYSNALGGVKVNVPAECFEKAKAILAEDESELLVAQKGEDRPRCKYCGSEDIELEVKGRRLAFLVFIWLQFPLWPWRRYTQCNHCGHRYKER